MTTDAKSTGVIDLTFTFYEPAVGENEKVEVFKVSLKTPGVAPSFQQGVEDYFFAKASDFVHLPKSTIIASNLRLILKSHLMELKDYFETSAKMAFNLSGNGQLICHIETPSSKSSVTLDY